MQTFLLQFFSGLMSATFLFLIAAGLSVIFGVSRIINISHGAFYMFGAYAVVAFDGHAAMGIGGFSALALVATLAIGCLGGLIESIILRHVYRGGMLLVALVTFGLLQVMQEMAKIIWGAEQTAVSRPSGLDGSFNLLGIAVPQYNLALIVIGIVTAFLLWMVIDRTRFGLLIRAAAIDRETLGALGVNVPMIFTGTFALGAALAGLAGVLAAPMVSISPTMGSTILIEAFAVVVIGGLGSLPGSLLGAFIVGEAMSFGVLFAPDFQMIILYVLMAFILLARPGGLLGQRPA
jgi:branched-subunit amino acid ABC-type transport system permease component